MPDPAIDPRTPVMDLLPILGPEAVGPAPAPTMEQALNYVRGLATTHYENFSVLSSLVPRRLRDDFAAVYAFCRWADDLGDETGNTPGARERSTRLLAWWRAELARCFDWAEHSEPADPSPDAAPSHPVYAALAQTVRRHCLPITPFRNLIDAFEQDQRVTRYQTWDQVVDYCTRSADPVGRIVLHLAGFPDTPANADLYRMSDATCTALQLTNFWQDVRRDLLERDRIYIPADSGISPENLSDWANRSEDPAARVPFIKRLRPLVHRTWELFDMGEPLPARLSPEIRPVVWLFGAGGRAVLGSVERMGCATLWSRPTLGAMRKAGLLGRAWFWAKLARPATGASSRASN